MMRDTRKMFIEFIRPFLILLLAGAFMGIPVIGDEQDGNTSDSTTLILLYMVGSDLESGTGHESGGDGTTDIMKMLDGYGEADAKDLNIVIAYGGAAIDGWKGMTIATIDELREDAADGIIGNEEIGAFRDPDADMGSPESLEAFLSYARDRYSGEKTYLFFWNHGSGFEGFGWDENTGNHLSIADIAGVLEGNGVVFDLIGFDACLMNGIEVARALEPYARYMLGSEEISAGGWSYDQWLPSLVQNPTQDPTETGMSIIRTFIEQEEALGNTCALIDLTRLEPVIDSLDELGATLDGSLISGSSVLPIARAYEKTTRFGENYGDSPGPGMIDLGTLADQLQASVPEADQATRNLKEAIAAAVVYSHHDDLISNATGLSIADPLTITEEKYAEAADILTISPSWDQFVASVRTQMNETFPRVEMVSIGTNTYEIREPTGVESVSVVYITIPQDTGEFLQLGTLPVSPDEMGRYTLPDWDGEWYYLQDAGNPDEFALIDLYYGDTTTTGIAKYLSEVDIIRNGTPIDAVMYTYVDPDSDWNRFSLRPYQTEGDETIFSRNGLTPQPEDTLITYASAYDEQGNDAGLTRIGTMNITSQLNIVSGPLPDGEYGWALAISTPDGQEDLGEVRLLSIANGTVTSIPVEDTQAPVSSQPE